MKKSIVLIQLPSLIYIFFLIVRSFVLLVALLQCSSRVAFSLAYAFRQSRPRFSSLHSQ